MVLKYSVDTNVSSTLPTQEWLGARWDSIDQAAGLASEVEEWSQISPAVIRAAKDLVARFANTVGSPLPQNATPHVSSDGEGGITFEWWMGSRSLTLFARADGSSGQLLAWGPDIREEMESIEQPTDAQIRSYWRRLNQG